MNENENTLDQNGNVVNANLGSTAIAGQSQNNTQPDGVINQPGPNEAFAELRREKEEALSQLDAMKADEGYQAYLEQKKAEELKSQATETGIDPKVLAYINELKQKQDVYDEDREEQIYNNARAAADVNYEEQVGDMPEPVKDEFIVYLRNTIQNEEMLNQITVDPSFNFAPYIAAFAASKGVQPTNNNKNSNVATFIPGHSGGSTATPVNGMTAEMQAEIKKIVESTP